MSPEPRQGRPSTRRSVLRAGALASTATLAGCFGGGGGGPGSTAAIPSTIKIGALGPTTNDNPIGTSITRSVELAAQKINDNGGINGSNIEVLTADTQLSPTTAKEEHRRLTFEEGCEATFGVFLPQGMLTTMNSVAQQEKLHFTAGAAGVKQARLVSRSVSVTGSSAAEEYEKYKYTFRAGPINTLDMADAMMQFLRDHVPDLGWERAAFLVENGGALSPFMGQMKDQIGEVLDVPIIQRTSSGVTNWTPIFDNVANENCDLLLGVFGLSATTAINQWADQQPPFEFGGVQIPGMVHSYYEELNGAPRYTWTMNTITPETQNTKNSQEFMDSYWEEFGTYPVFNGPIAYDAVLMYAKAIRETGTTEAEELIPHLEEMTFTPEDGATVMKRFEFKGPDSEFAHDPKWNDFQEYGFPVVQQWQENGGEPTMEAFAPDGVKTADYRKPPWV